MISSETFSLDVRIVARTTYPLACFVQLSNSTIDKVLNSLPEKLGIRRRRIKSPRSAAFKSIAPSAGNWVTAVEADIALHSQLNV